MTSMFKSHKTAIGACMMMVLIMAAVALFQVGCSSTPPAPPATQPETAVTPAATETVTIATPTAPPTPEETKAPGKKGGDVAPYALSKGKRDPFVPFGGNAPAAAPVEPIVPTSAPVAPATPGEAKTPEAQSPETAAPVQQEVILPVQVTGTFVSGGKNFAILTSTSGEAGAKGSPSFVVSSGDKVGEYRVKAITATKVVLLWNGKEYSIKIKSFGPGSSPKGKATLTTTGEAPGSKTLPAPEKQAAPQTTGGPKTAPPPPPGAEPPGGSSEKVKGTEPAK